MRTPLYFLQIILTIIIIGLTLSSCSKKITVFDKYIHTPNSGWDSRDTIKFNVTQIPDTALYIIDVGLLTSKSFPFSSLSLIVGMRVLPSQEVFEDTLICDLVDDKGNILGKGISRYQYNFPLKNINLNQGDSLEVNIRHAMRQETLKGILDIGLKVSKIK